MVSTFRPAPLTPPTDPTDAIWNKREQALFADLKISLNGPQQLASVQGIYAYPNPMAGSIARGPASSLANYSLRAVLVEQQYQVRQRLVLDNIAQSTRFEFDFTPAGLKSGQICRRYYMLHNNSGRLYKGHGDLRYR